MRMLQKKYSGGEVHQLFYAPIFRIDEGPSPTPAKHAIRLYADADLFRTL